ncbi:TetR/AcrR family transcriptional regulator [Oceanidesulfovibrio marinus]|uniref:TetR/AcrR family transcriptional regulator n=1 Tax=Oceanidesulfovibrio marinus TaxID=370038 RepID=A0A6P1ZHT4_9BACT|nr:TetR/AcrR family transcriptional regulator [Oceanidesulfovibrio marinus]TVM34141.1 TetR/AcrR family transcriptional regulator [Oceanidesulfovibrio marinus]
MVQVLKDCVRNQIAEAAEVQFAKVGYTKATIGAIAREAGVATGTIYKYFADKEALFHAIITAGFVEEFSSLTRRRIAAFAQPDGLRAGRSILESEAGELLRFWVRNRLKVVIILARAEGSAYESFGASYVQDMAEQTIAQAREQFPQIEITDLFRFMVHKILSDSVRGIVAILENFRDEASICEAFSASTAYQLAGINGFIEWSLAQGAQDARI